MTITLTLPDDIAQHPDPGREALEALVIGGYRSSALTSYQARQLLAYDVEDFERDLQTLERLETQVFFQR